MNRDDINHASFTEVANATMAVIDRLQHQPAHVRLLALCCAFTLAVKASGIPFQDLASASANLMHHSEERLRPEFKAVQQYLSKEDIQ